MKLGMFMMPLHPPGRNAWETLAEDRAAVLLADRLGFDEAFVGEHVTDLAENVTSSMMFLASLAHETRRIKLGTGTINMPNSHPANVAAQAAMLDHMLQGRFIMGISPGGLMSDAEVFGNFQKDRNAIFLESINMVLDIWKGKPPYDLHGEYFSVSTARTMMPEIGQGAILKPFQAPHPPIVVTAVAPHSKGVTEAAKRGWTPISANFLLPKWVASHWPRYVEGCEAVGNTARTEDWRLPSASSWPTTKPRRSATASRPRARTTSTSSNCCASSSPGAAPTCSRKTRTHPTTASPRNRSPTGWCSPERWTAWWNSCSPSARKPAISAPCSTPAWTGKTRRWGSAPCNCWPNRSCRG
jgi:hypothetical protein